MQTKLTPQEDKDPNTGEPPVDIEEAQTDYEDIVASTLRLQGRAKGEQTLQRMGADLRRELEHDRADALIAFPAYAALAFRGCLRYSDKREITKRAGNNPVQSLAEIKLTNTVGVAQSAQNAWVRLVAASGTAAWFALVLVAREDSKPRKQNEQSDEGDES